LALELLLSIRAMLHHRMTGQVIGKNTTLLTLFSLAVLNVFLPMSFNRVGFQGLELVVGW